ncbi:glycine zipper family protein [Mariprofundus ferrooxydans]|uniref:glycine zipper family protein n=1 Tax=Mariprofundus ferrooxydans TaxID=314344 RepID=UPI00035C3E18|nr:glycine zipper family protein [Mariprofundus ferrooxydans]
MKRYLSIVAIGLLAGCSTAYQQRTATQGAVVGAATGAVIGAQSDQVVEGAVIGGVLGGLVGAMLADNRDDRIHESAPRYHRSNCGRGDIYFSRARHARELNRRIILMRQGIAYCPNNPAAHNDLGVALMLWGDSNGARMHFRQALRFDPQYYPARHNLERMSRYRAPARYQRPVPVYRQPQRQIPHERIEQRREREPQMRNQRNEDYRSGRQGAERKIKARDPRYKRSSERDRQLQNRDRRNNGYRQNKDDDSRDRRED